MEEKKGFGFFESYGFFSQVLTQCPPFITDPNFAIDLPTTQPKSERPDEAESEVAVNASWVLNHLVADVIVKEALERCFCLREVLAPLVSLKFSRHCHFFLYAKLT